MDRFFRACDRSSLTILASCLAACMCRGYILAVLLCSPVSGLLLPDSLYLLTVSRIIDSTNSAARLHILLSRLESLLLFMKVCLVLFNCWKIFGGIKN